MLIVGALILGDTNFVIIRLDRIINICNFKRIPLEFTP